MGVLFSLKPFINSGSNLKENVTQAQEYIILIK